MGYAFYRLRKNESEAEPITEINIIPVIDISLVLLVILFVTAPLLSYPNAKIELPRSTAKGTDEAALAITYTIDGRLAVAARFVDWAGLGPAIEAELKRVPDAPVVLRVDREVPYRTVQKLIRTAKAAGGQSLSLATEPYQ